MAIINSGLVRSVVMALPMVLLLGACSSTESGVPQEPTPQTSQDNGGEEQPEDLLAPPVQNPKDISQTPLCDLVAPGILSGFGLPEEGTAGEVAGDPNCRWSDGETAAGLSIFADTDRDGLSTTYEQETAFTMFEPVEVAGHPAAATQRAPSETHCEVFVGMTDTQVLVFQTDVPRRHEDEGDPCEWGTQLAEEIVSNIP